MATRLTEASARPATEPQDEANALVDMAHHLTSNDLENVLTRSTAEVRRLTGCDMSWLALYEGEVVRYIAADGNRTTLPSIRPLQGKGIWQQISERRAPITIQIDPSKPLDPQQFPIATAEDLRSVAAVPLWLDGELAGSLVASFRRPHDFTRVDLARLERLAGVTALAVRTARLVGAAEHATDFEARLRALNEALLTDEQVWVRACEEIQQLFNVDGVWLTRLQPGGEMLQGIAATGVAQPVADRRIPRHPASSMWQAVERREPVIRPDALAGESPYRSIVNSRSLLVAPLVHGDQVLGTLTVFDARVGRFTGEEQRRILVVAGQVALAIARADLVADLRHREAEATLLFQLSERVGRLANEAEIITALADGARELCGADFAGIASVEAKGRPLRWRGVRGAGPMPAAMVKQPGDPLYEDLAAMRPQLVADVAAENQQHPGRFPYLQHEGAASAVLAPFPLPGSGCFGELLIGFRTKRNPGPRDLQLARSIASLAAVALEKTKLLEDARAGERRARGLYDLARALTFGLEPQSMLERLCRQAAGAFGATAAHIWLVDAQGNLSVAAQHGNPPELASVVKALRIPADAQSLAALAVRTGEAQLVRDSESDPRISRELYELLHWRSLIGAPLLSQGKAIGTLMLGHPDPDRFGPDDLKSATTITAQAAVAFSHARLYATLQQTSLQNTRLLKESRDSERRARALYEIARVLTSSLELGPLLDELCRQAGRSFQATGSVLLLLEPGGDLVVTAQHGYSGPQAEAIRRVRIAPGQSSVATVALQTREAQVVMDALTDSRVSPALRDLFGTRSLLMAPLESQGKPIGVLSLVHGDPMKFSIEDRETAATLASQAAAAISHAQLFAELQHRQRITALEARIAKAAGASLDLDQVMLAVCREAVDGLGVDRVSIWLADEPRWLRRVAEAGRPGPTGAPTRLAHDGTLDDPAGFGKGTRRKDRSAMTAEAAELSRKYQVADSISVPLGTGGKLMGVLLVIDVQMPDRFTAKDVELAEAVGRHAQMALANALAYGQQQEALRRLDELNRTRSGFLATMRHELRTPLNAIVGFTDLLSEEATGPLNQKQARYVGNVREAGGQLLQLIDDILEFVSVQSEDEVAHESFDAGLVVSELIGTMTPRAEARGLTLQTGGPATILPVVGDRTRLGRALRHLVDNAIKFTESGGVVHLGARVENDLVIEVKDTGIGIPPEDQQRIFEPFVQGDSSKTRRYTGTGLGLAIAKRIVELHGGTLTVHSSPGAGSVFTVRLPLATAQPAEGVAA